MVGRALNPKYNWYKSTHHQSLLDGVANNVGIGSLVVVVVGSANVFMDILLLVGACCRTR